MNFYMLFGPFMQVEVGWHAGLVRLDSDEHSSLFGPFISYKENEVL